MSLGKYTLTHYDALRSMQIFATHWGHLTHICIVDLTIIVSDNGLSPNRRQAIFWTEMGILLIGPLETNFNEILIEIQIFSFIRYISKGRLQMATILYRPQCIVISIRSMSIHTEDAR